VIAAPLWVGLAETLAAGAARPGGRHTVTARERAGPLPRERTPHFPPFVRQVNVTLTDLELLTGWLHLVSVRVLLRPVLNACRSAHGPHTVGRLDGCQEFGPVGGRGGAYRWPAERMSQSGLPRTVRAWPAMIWRVGSRRCAQLPASDGLARRPPDGRGCRPATTSRRAGQRRRAGAAATDGAPLPTSASGAEQHRHGVDRQADRAAFQAHVIGRAEQQLGHRAGGIGPRIGGIGHRAGGIGPRTGSSGDLQ
jgi:hypothetical protein